LQTVRALIGGATRRIRVCTRCLRSGKVTEGGRVAREAVSAPNAANRSAYSPAIRAGKPAVHLGPGRLRSGTGTLVEATSAHNDQ
jgi:hypothetical protein